MRDLFRFLFRQRNNLLFLALMALSLSLLVNGNMHQRAQAISSSNAVIGQIYAWRNEASEYARLGEVNRQLAIALAAERDRKHTLLPVADSSAHAEIDSSAAQHYRFLTAQVINSTVHKERNYITLGSGSLAGIRPDMGVIGANGLVGIVRDVSPRFALVTSILGNEYRTSVQLKRSGHFGLLAWDTGDPSTASLTDVAKHVAVNAGDTVVTRGNDGIFPPGVPVGTVIAVMDDPGSPSHIIRVHLSEDLSRTAYVHVVTDLLKAERDSLEARASQP
ncbi:MAG: rod shape-determining protein MreC [Flavobacteriales bacterium]|nr:rod shape-determining protein MreC [Flavobacteriales bacterium]MCL4280743.1 rod shape-determining protein MreC [Flavobacteriales bacterium]